MLKQIIVSNWVVFAEDYKMSNINSIFLKMLFVRNIFMLGFLY